MEKPKRWEEVSESDIFEAEVGDGVFIILTIKKQQFEAGSKFLADIPDLLEYRIGIGFMVAQRLQSLSSFGVIEKSKPSVIGSENFASHQLPLGFILHTGVDELSQNFQRRCASEFRGGLNEGVGAAVLKKSSTR